MHDEIADAGANSDSARNPKLNLCGMFGLALVILGTVSGLLAVWFIGMVENAPQGWRYDASENWRFNLMNWIGPLALALTMFSLVGTVLAAIGVFSRPRRYSAIAAAVLLLNVCLAALFLLAWVQSMSMPRPP